MILRVKGRLVQSARERRKKKGRNRDEAQERVVSTVDLEILNEASFIPRVMPRCPQTGVLEDLQKAITALYPSKHDEKSKLQTDRYRLPELAKHSETF